jgi:hypothetical protein
VLTRDAMVAFDFEMMMVVAKPRQVEVWLA